MKPQNVDVLGFVVARGLLAGLTEVATALGVETLEDLESQAGPEFRPVELIFDSVAPCQLAPGLVESGGTSFVVVVVERRGDDDVVFSHQFFPPVVVSHQLGTGRDDDDCESLSQRSFELTGLVDFERFAVGLGDGGEGLCAFLHGVGAEDVGGAEDCQFFVCHGSCLFDAF